MNFCYDKFYTYILYIIKVLILCTIIIIYFRLWVHVHKIIDDVQVQYAIIIWATSVLPVEFPPKASTVYI